MAEHNLNDRVAFWSEARLIASYARKVWGLISRSNRAALGLALGMMCAMSVCNTLFPMFQGWMLDAIQTSVTAQESDSVIYRTAAFYLLAIAGIFSRARGDPSHTLICRRADVHTD